MIWGKRINADVHAVEAEQAPPAVTTVGNRIYFYCEVTCASTLELIKELRELDASHMYYAKRDGLETPNPIYIHINSEGGSLFDAFAVVDAIKACDTPIIGVGEGMIASAATLILCACKRRYIQPHAIVLLHQLSTGYGGDYEKFKDYAGMLDIVMDKMVQFYAGHSKIEETKIREMLKRDTWLTSDGALTAGLVDGISN